MEDLGVARQCSFDYVGWNDGRGPVTPYTRCENTALKGHSLCMECYHQCKAEFPLFDWKRGE